MIRILVDSASDYSIEEAKEKNLTLLPISICFGADTYIEGKNISRGDFYKLLTEGKDFPKTSQPSPQAFLEVFEDAREKGDDVICILLSSALSGTYQSAVLAKNMADYDNIYLIDTLSVSYAIRIMTDYACRLVLEGMSAPEIVEKIEALKPRVKILAAVDTLEYLCKGGRISKAVASVGTVANIKPVVTATTEGKVGMLGKCLGKAKAANYLLNYLQDNEMDTDFPCYTIYTCGTDNCEKLEKKLQDNDYRFQERLQIGATIGTHVGPEAFGIVFVTK